MYFDQGVMAGESTMLLGRYKIGRAGIAPTYSTYGTGEPPASKGRTYHAPSVMTPILAHTQASTAPMTRVTTLLHQPAEEYVITASGPP